MEEYESQLFKTANKLRGKIPPSDYKFFVLPIVFIRYMSGKKDDGVWEEIVNARNEKELPVLLDKELSAILPDFDEVKNPYKDLYSTSNLPDRTIRDLVNLINEIDISERQERIDYLGRIYEYFIGNFAATEGNRGGEFFTPYTVVELLVQMLSPQEGTVYDPACGTGGMFIQSDKYSGKKLKFVGQEQNYKTIMLAYMNGILHGLNLNILKGDTLLNDRFPSLKADYVISNPPFNMKDWGSESLSASDPRVFGMVNKNNANYMWIQHFVYHLKDTGRAGFVISNGALTSSNEADLCTRQKLLEMNCIDCVVQLPDKMFLGTAIPSALIFIDMGRRNTQEILFIDASSFGESVTKTQNVLSKNEIERISSLYHAFKNAKDIQYNVKGFSWLVLKENVISNDCKLLPSIYTGVEERIVDIAENEKIIKSLKEQLLAQIKKSSTLAESLYKELI